MLSPGSAVLQPFQTLLRMHGQNGAPLMGSEVTNLGWHEKLQSIICTGVLVSFLTRQSG